MELEQRDVSSGIGVLVKVGGNIQIVILHSMNWWKSHKQTTITTI